MASGHVNRIKRPNTWLHRPMLQKREKSSCQLGAVHTWHNPDMPAGPTTSGVEGRRDMERKRLRLPRFESVTCPDRTQAKAKKGRHGLSGGTFEVDRPQFRGGQSCLGLPGCP
jgi:hypothetical protein